MNVITQYMQKYIIINTINNYNKKYIIVEFYEVKHINQVKNYLFPITCKDIVTSVQELVF